MDVLPAESQKLTQLVQTWSQHANYELEATFGPRSQVDATAFFAIAGRLKAKGYEQISQDDRLNIILPEQIRFTLVSTGIIQQYCRDDVIAGRPYVAMIKDRAFVESNLDLDEYDTRIKIRREVELAPDDPRIREVLERWDVHRKAFRLIKRWSFSGQGIQFDLSIVRSSRRDPRGEFRWVRNFREYDLFKEAPTYEVEVELKRPTTETPDVQVALKDLVRGIGEVLRGYQRNSLLMRKTARSRILANYRALTDTDAFRGVAPITLETKNMTEPIDSEIPNIRDGYNVTDKADGLRVLAFCDPKGELFMLDMAMNVYRTGLMREGCRSSLLDGEWITKDKKGGAISQLLLFDVYHCLGNKVDGLPFVLPGEDGRANVAAAQPGEQVAARFNQLKMWTATWNEGDGPTAISKGVNANNRLLVAEKQFQIAAGARIFKYASSVLEKDRPYHTDGLIFTPNILPLPSRAGETFKAQFKWKPASENTVDFLVNFEKSHENPLSDRVNIGINPSTDETIRYKTMRLYVGSSSTAETEDPRATMLYGDSYVEKKKRDGHKDRYAPVLFNPTDFPDTMASIAYVNVELDLETGEEFVKAEGNGEPIRGNSVVEMAYDPAREPGWRWYPMRVRHDKTERLQRGTLARTLNAEKTANSVWNSIHEPITLSMIRTGAEEPTAEEVATIRASRPDAGAAGVGKTYYVERKLPEKDLLAVRGLRDFHNQYIKEKILLQSTLGGKAKRLIDIGCGKGGDIQKWRRNNVAFALGIDPAGENIRNTKDGAYARLLQMKKRTTMPPMLFVIGDCALPLVGGEAGATAEERDILRSVFGRVRPEGAVPPYLETTAAGAMRAGADVISTMFVIHYFFESAEKLNGLIANINDTLKVGGYFIGCCFDGEKIFNALKPLHSGQSKVGKIGDNVMWTITKSYEANELTNDEESLGLAIDVDFISIGSEQREYLVPFGLLTKKMKSIGLELMSDAEARQIGLRTSTNMFDVSYDMARAENRKFTMDKDIQEYSFLNRWFIFKRKGTGELAVEADQAEAQLAEEFVEDAVAGVSRVPDPLAGNTAVGAEPVALPTTEGPVGTAAVPSTGIPTIRVRRAAAAAKEEGAAAAGISVVRTVPVSGHPAGGRTFAPAEIFYIGLDAAAKDVIGLGDATAGRWLSTAAPFPIVDAEDKTVYPSVEHYYAGMKLKMATDKPQLATTVASQSGIVHRDYLRDREALKVAGARNIPADKDNQMLAAEMKRIRQESSAKSITTKYGATFNEGAWLAAKDAALEYALAYRYKHDPRFKQIVNKIRDAGKYILLSAEEGGAEFGGKRARNTGVIDGANKVGKMIMRIAGFSPF